MGLVRREEIILNNKNSKNIHCDEMNGILIKKENVIDNESIISVDEGQCLIIVSNNNIIDFTTDPGNYTFNEKTKPLALNVKLNEKLIKIFNKHMKKSSENNYEKKAYFINTSSINNKFSMNNPISYNDNNFNLTIDIRCYGQFVIKITNPISFYYTYGGILQENFILDDVFKNQLLDEFLEAIKTVFIKLSEENIKYDELSECSKKITNLVKENLKSVWEPRGIEVVKVSIISIIPTDESMKNIKEALTDTKTYSKKSISDRKCPFCGKKVGENAKFCPECGAKLLT